MTTPKATEVPALTLQQTAILDTKQLLAYIKPISVKTYWSIVAKDPRFPKPIMGGAGAKALHSRELVDLYLKEVGRTGFIYPTEAERDAA